MPKTIRNVYDSAVSFEKLLRAHKKARKCKRGKREIILFELNLENELLRIENELKHGTYKPGKYKEFKIYEPNEKKIKKYTKKLKEGKTTLPEIQRSIAGWLGYVKHADSYNLRNSMFYIEG